MPAMRKLNARQQAFVREYLVDLNPGPAASRAGYQRGLGVYAHGHYLLAQPHIQAAIQQAMDERAERTRITADRVLQELAAVAFSDIGAVCAWRQHDVTDEAPRKTDRRRYDTRLIVFDSSEIDPLARRAIARIRRYEGGAVRFDMHDKLGALELLGKHLGLFAVKRLEVTGKDGGPMRVSGERSEAATLADRLACLPREQRDRLRGVMKEVMEATKGMAVEAGAAARLGGGESEGDG